MMHHLNIAKAVRRANAEALAGTGRYPGLPALSETWSSEETDSWIIDHLVPTLDVIGVFVQLFEPRAPFRWFSPTALRSPEAVSETEGCCA